MNKQQILSALDAVVHPETGQSLAQGGFVNGVTVQEGHIAVELAFRRQRDPFAASLARQAAVALREAFPSVEVAVTVAEATPAAVTTPPPEPSRRLPNVRKIVAVASGKGGVGKSTVAAHLAVTLASQGYRVGILDADIYGPSQPALFGVEGYIPPVDDSKTDGTAAEAMIPAESMGVKIMSIGFFVAPDNALVWRGPMATGALRQMIRQTAWDALDFLLIDLPPGTGDIHLSVAHEVETDGAIIVTTPQDLAIADVRRGIAMFRSEGIDVPVLGVVENMAWFTPAELPDNRYYIFGRGGAARLAMKEDVEFLGEIPIVQSVTDSGAESLASKGIAPEVATRYETISRRIVEKLAEKR